MNLATRCVEDYRDPMPSGEAPYGWTYRTVQLHAQGGHLAPLAAPTSAIAVADLLP